MGRISTQLSDLRSQWQVQELLLQNNPVNTWHLVVPADPLRWAICFSAHMLPGDTGATFVTTAPNAANSAGFFLTANQPTLNLSYRDFGGLIQMQWYFLAGALSNLLSVFNVLSVSGGF